VGTEAVGTGDDSRVVIAQIVVAAGKVTLHIGDVAAAPIAVNDRACRQGVLNQGNVDGRVDAAVRIAMGGYPVARFGIPLGDIEFRLVGDVADHTGLRPAAQQRALRPFEHFEAVHVDHVDVRVARGKLHGLIVEIQSNVRKGSKGCGRLPAHRTGTQAAHEQVRLAGSVAADGDVRQILHDVVEVRDAQLGQL